MIDIRQTIVPKSDQMNADDLIGGPRTIRVTKISLLAAADQPIAINFEGDNGKPYKPCKSMRRVLVTAWGPDGAAYAGRSMTLYRDDSVAFGGQQVGGIRISHMTNIERPMTMALTATRGSRKGFTVQPLADPLADLEAQADGAAAKGYDSYAAFWGELNKDQKKALLAGHENRKSVAAAADAERERLESERPESNDADAGADADKQQPADEAFAEAEAAARQGVGALNEWWNGGTGAQAAIGTDKSKKSLIAHRWRELEAIAAASAEVDTLEAAQ